MKQYKITDACFWVGIAKHIRAHSTRELRSTPWNSPQGLRLVMQAMGSMKIINQPFPTAGRIFVSEFRTSYFMSTTTTWKTYEHVGARLGWSEGFVKDSSQAFQTLLGQTGSPVVTVGSDLLPNLSNREVESFMNRHLHEIMQDAHGSFDPCGAFEDAKWVAQATHLASLVHERCGQTVEVLSSDSELIKSQWNTAQDEPRPMALPHLTWSQIARY
jgi:hypothetical protein